MDEQTPKAKRSDPLMVQSVAKAFRVLSAFDKGHGLLSLSQIAQRSDMDVSTAQRFTHTLTQLGYLKKDPQSRQFELAIKTLDLAYHFTRGSRLLDRAQPALMQLSRETEEAVSLTVLDGTEIVFVSRYFSRRMLNTDVITGTRLPAYCTSPGRAILSRLPEQEVDDILARSDLRAYTHSTITDPKRIKEVLVDSRLNGFASIFEEMYHGDGSIAAPVIGPSGDVIAAISVAVPLTRMSREETLRHIPGVVVAAARGISFL